MSTRWSPIALRRWLYDLVTVRAFPPLIQLPARTIVEGRTSSGVTTSEDGPGALGVVTNSDIPGAGSSCGVKPAGDGAVLDDTPAGSLVFSNLVGAPGGATTAASGENP